MPMTRPNSASNTDQPLRDGIRACINEALRCKASGEPKTLFFNLSGYGHLDMSAYEDYFAGKLSDFEYPAEAIQASLKNLPQVDWPPKAA